MEAFTTTTDAELFSRWFLAGFFTSVCLFYLARINLLARRLQQPVTYRGEPGSTHHLTHSTFRVFRMLIFLVCLVRVPLPGIDTLLVPVAALWQPGILLTGCGLLTFSFAGIVAINLYMKEVWRSGTRRGEPTTLIQSGPYAVSRNPMTILVLLGQLGFFLALPSLFTFICLAVGAWAVIAQVNVEQRHLNELFGEQYRRYATSTPNWLFR